ncbi:MAG: cytochrome c biogenesis protein CcdA [Planctomycetota bacterium]|jgi:thiol:disulfide interchange protein DsbD
MNLGKISVCAVLVLGMLVPIASEAADSKKAPPVGVDLKADATAIVPGGTVRLAVILKLERGWHIYWRNSGESGKAPTFKWRVPQGFSVGPIKFPPPERHVERIEKEEMHTFILEGQPVFVAELKAPGDTRPGSTVDIGLNVEWLICKKMCYLGNGDAALKLPVVASKNETKPANELEFPREPVQYIKGMRALASVDKVKPGAKFELAVVFEVFNGHHINSNKPLSKYLIATDLFPHKTKDLWISRPRFPAGQLEKSPLPNQNLSVYRGKTIIRLPVEADKSLTGKEVRISGVVTYQACNDKSGVCFPRTAADWSITLPVAGPNEKIKAINAHLFKGSTKPPTQPARSVPSSAEERVAEQTPTTSDTWMGRTQRWLAEWGLIGYLIMAFIGGFILNLTPCVLPVISIKILSFVQQSKESRLCVFTLGLAFSLGILISFIILGVLIVMLGQQWGGLFQRPEVVIALAGIVTAFALSLFGLFTLFPPKFVGQLGEKVQQEGHFSSFAMGILATVLGTACTAPFLTMVIAIASQQTPTVGMSIFVAAGVGMAFPYALLAVKPVWLRFIPKPGPWMKTFEHIMAFILFAVVIWLFNTLATQLGAEGVVWALYFLLFVAVGSWFYGKVEFGASLRKKILYYSFAGIFLVGGWLFCFHLMTTIPQLIAAQRKLLLGSESHWLDSLDWSKNKIPWLKYTPQRARKAVEAGRTVFVDYTAEWCKNCKTNEKLIIDTKPVREAMKRLRILPFKADYTLYDPEIRADLEKYGSGGVPLYLVIPANRPGEVIRLDEFIVSPKHVVRQLEKAGPSTASAPTR